VQLCFSHGRFSSNTVPLAFPGPDLLSFLYSLFLLYSGISAHGSSDLTSVDQFTGKKKYSVPGKVLVILLPIIAVTNLVLWLFFWRRRQALTKKKQAGTSVFSIYLPGRA
jgi:hypothetical protein